jgi:hypothetical protein
MFLSYLMLLVALCLSAVAAYYSIVGLAAIFAAAVLPIILMGSILEVAKLTCTVWLHEYWKKCKLTMKLYLVPAVFILMIITSMGIFGFLSKAHSDQSLISGDVQAKISIYDEKIKVEKDNIEAAKKALYQMDAQVDQMLGRTDNERGAERAVSIRRNQAKERANLLNEISRAQKEIAKLNNEAAPIRAEVRKVEAEVGPIKYIAALIYGDNPDQNLLERAVRWVIILLVAVFDPLAVMMLLAATESISWTRESRQQMHLSVGRAENTDDLLPPVPEDPDKDNKEVEEVFDNMRLVARALDAEDEKLRAEEANAAVTDIINDEYEPVIDLGDCYKCGTALLDAPGIGLFCPNKNCDVVDNVNGAEVIFANTSYDDSPSEVESTDTVPDPVSDEEKLAMREWKANNPNTTLKEQRRLLDLGLINELPWNANLGLQADNEPSVTGQVRGFGIEFPTDARKGDQFLRVDVLPTRLYKYNGTKWIEVDKNYSDQYAFDTAYIDHLITKIESGEYDPELLSDAERDQVTNRLKEQTSTGDA